MLTRWRVTAALLAAAVGGVPMGPGAAPEPVAAQAVLEPFPGPRTRAIEPYTAYDGQTTCARTAKPGALALAKILREKFASDAWIGIKRSCAGDTVSEHKEGRAIDWGVNVEDTHQRLQAKRAIRWLFGEDRFGNRHAVARRLGVMYIIWNKRMWRAYRPFDGWQPYEGHPHTDHMHISLARAGGKALTSYWTGRVADVPPAWLGRS